MRAHLTEKTIAKLPRPATGHRTTAWDTRLGGFGVVLRSDGGRSFVYQYGPAGRRRRIKLEADTVEDARQAAEDARRTVREGADPLTLKATSKQAVEQATTWAAWALQRCDELATEVDSRTERPRVSPRWASECKRHLQVTSKAWNLRRLDSITGPEVQALYDAIAKTRATEANRWFSAVRRAFQVAVRRGLVGANPAAMLERRPDALPRQVVLTDKELVRVVKAIKKLTDPVVKTALLLLAGTGARLSEVRAMRWQDLDLRGRLWTLPVTKSGRPRTIALTLEQVKMLRGLARLDDSLVFPGNRFHLDRDGQPRETRPVSDSHLSRTWVEVCQVAKVEGKTIHDLRRSFATLARRQADLGTASRILGHTSTAITAKVYDVWSGDDLRAARDHIVLPFEKRRAR